MLSPLYKMAEDLASVPGPLIPVIMHLHRKHIDCHLNLFQMAFKFWIYI